MADEDSDAITEGQYREALMTSLANISAAQLHIAGIAVAAVRADGSIALRPPTPEETAGRMMAGDIPTPTVLPGKTSTRWGDGGPLVWVFTPPPPFGADVEIVCSPDQSEVVGFRCMAVRKYPGGERKKWRTQWIEEPEI
jgi:hypothetical protein